MRAVGRLGEMLVPDRVEQVGLAEADAAAPEDRIVFRGIPWESLDRASRRCDS
jgi:hypothetical protein